MPSSLRRTFPATYWLVARLAGRRARITYVAILSVVCCTLLSARVRATLFEHRAGRLLESIKELRPNRSTSQDADAILSRYSNVVTQCFGLDCQYTIKLEHLMPLGERLYRWKPNVGYIWFPLLQWLGFRETRLLATVTVASGVVAGKSYEIETWNPGTTGAMSGYWLVARARTVASFPFHTSFLLDTHPNHLFSRPGGCNPCIATYAEVTPYADERENQQAFDINLSCVSRFFPCSEMEQFMPSATRERVYEEQTYDWASRPPCTLTTVERYGRDFPIAALVKIKRMTAPTSLRDYGHLNYELVRMLKGTVPSTGTLPLAADARIDLGALRPGSEVIVFVLEGGWLGVSQDCGVVAASQHNLNLAERGGGLV